MDFGFGKGSKGSIKRKQSNSFLHSLSRNTTARASAIPFPSPQNSTHNAEASSSNQTYQTPQSQHSPSFASPATASSDSHSRTPNLHPYGGNQYNYQSPDVLPDSVSTYSYAPGQSRQRTPSSAGQVGRTISGSTGFARTTTYNESIRGPSSIGGTSGGTDRLSEGIKRPEDVFAVVKERLFSWSYMMQWYQGDVSWFNTVTIPASAIESHLGAKLDSRSRNFLILGASLATLFDITVMADFMKAVIRLLDEWEAWTEGGAKGVKGLFKGQKGKRDPMEPDTHIAQISLPFPPDFFQVHASTCSIIRDVYKKLLGMMLPSIAAPPPQAAPGAAPLARAPHPSSDPIQTLFHPSTFIQSANFSETDPLSPNISFNPSIFNANHGSNISYNTFSPETLSISGFQTPSTAQHSGTNSDGRVATPFGDVMSTGAGGGFATGEGVSVSIGAVQHDAFQALLAGELPGDRTLVGDGQKMIPQLLELFQKLDARLKKQFSLLIREGDHLARRTLDDEIATVLSSLTSSTPLSYDFDHNLSLGADSASYTYAQAQPYHHRQHHHHNRAASSQQRSNDHGESPSPVLQSDSGHSHSHSSGTSHHHHPHSQSQLQYQQQQYPGSIPGSGAATLAGSTGGLRKQASMESYAPSSNSDSFHSSQSHTVVHPRPPGSGGGYSQYPQYPQGVDEGEEEMRDLDER